MRHLVRALLALVLFTLPVLAPAQTVGGSVQFPAGYAPGMSLCVKQPDGTCVPIGNGVSLPAVSAPKPAASTATPGNIAVASVFQSALAGLTTRLGCTLQNTSGANLLVYVGPIATASAGAALVIAPGGTFGCVAGGVVLTDQISVASGTAGSTYVMVAQ